MNASFRQCLQYLIIFPWNNTFILPQSKLNVIAPFGYRITLIECINCARTTLRCSNECKNTIEYFPSYLQNQTLAR